MAGFHISPVSSSRSIATLGSVSGWLVGWAVFYVPTNTV